ncbi:hypothetical protein F503_03894 [Ophiostoma piceae UAMH 11346]|uniref:Uncharacterized protein n=1 Tax=Ophiostoma piceae (strain UAMH 11346) TaxID=1262450 RepID=S3BVM8_OPHP1|nr:hypothetical protein F503_03894 [Ophiostoma piceae UAMH 11346]
MALLGRARGLCLALVLLLCTFVAANVEKAVFVASAGRDLHSVHALGALDLPRLAPDSDRNAWRTFLPALFPWSLGFPQNATTWVRLDGLVPGQRYELRVCWAATQPTEFVVDVYDAEAVLEAPELAAELLAASTPLASGSSSSSSSTQPPTFARIVATADYITVPMSPDVLPVLTDIILDPFLLNILPRSLLPTVAAVLAVAAASAVLARRVVLPQLRQLAAVEKKT